MPEPIQHRRFVSKQFAARLRSIEESVRDMQRELTELSEPEAPEGERDRWREYERAKLAYVETILAGMDGAETTPDEAERRLDAAVRAPPEQTEGDPWAITEEDVALITEAGSITPTLSEGDEWEFRRRMQRRALETIRNRLRARVESARLSPAPTASEEPVDAIEALAERAAYQEGWEAAMASLQSRTTAGIEIEGEEGGER